MAWNDPHVSLTARMAEILDAKGVPYLIVEDASGLDFAFAEPLRPVSGLENPDLPLLHGAGADIYRFPGTARGVEALADGCRTAGFEHYVVHGMRDSALYLRMGSLPAVSFHMHDRRRILGC